MDTLKYLMNDLWDLWPLIAIITSGSVPFSTYWKKGTARCMGLKTPLNHISKYSQQYFNFKAAKHTI
jgi:hypothetical protein